jgi:hypothetical protein
MSRSLDIGNLCSICMCADLAVRLILPSAVSMGGSISECEASLSNLIVENYRSYVCSFDSVVVARCFCRAAHLIALGCIVRP